MITRIEGELTQVRDGKAELLCPPITYELLIPSTCEQQLATMIGQPVEFFTLHYFEIHGQGAAYIPRLIGFLSVEERAFFELFTTVKGMGSRKTLRAFQLPIGTIAAAIAEKDASLLVSLPEIGKRTAETIIAELHGKVDQFVELKSAGASTNADDPRRAMIDEALAVLVQLGEPRHTARLLIDRALAADPALARSEDLINASYRLKNVVHS